MQYIFHKHFSKRTRYTTLWRNLASFKRPTQFKKFTKCRKNLGTYSLEWRILNRNGMNLNRTYMRGHVQMLELIYFVVVATCSIERASNT